MSSSPSSRLERVRVGLEARHVVARAATRAARARGAPTSTAWLRDLVHAHPQPQVVLRQAPLLAELVDVAERGPSARRSAGAGSAGRTGRTSGAARWPSSEPTVMPSITGLNACMMPPSIFAIGSSSSGSSSSPAPSSVGMPPDSEPASDSNRGRCASSVRCIHIVRVTGSMVEPRPDVDVGQRRWRCRPGARRPGSAARAGCDRGDRRSARSRPRWRSRPPAGGRRPSSTGPCCCSIRARSPNSGMPWKGSSPSGPNGPRSLTWAW